jgi:hypothetical protein
MIPRRIFTKRFFQLSDYDQAAIVSSIILDIEETIGRHLNPIHDRQAEQRVKCIRAKATLFGIHGVLLRPSTLAPTTGSFQSSEEWSLREMQS